MGERRGGGEGQRRGGGAGEGERRGGGGGEGKGERRGGGGAGIHMVDVNRVVKLQGGSAVKLPSTCGT